MSAPPSTPALRRALGKWDLTAIGINQVIGSAIFLLPADVARLVGSWSPLLFLAIGLSSLFVALCFAEVGSRFDTTGGPIGPARVAFGLTTLALAKPVWARAISTASPPLTSLSAQAPPGARISVAKSSTASPRPSARSRSTARWPVAEAAMSLSTRSAGPPSRARSSACTRGSRKSPSISSTPASAATGCRSTATTRQPLRAAYWLQLPGAAPRSRTRAPRLSRAKRSSSSCSLNTERARQPS